MKIIYIILDILQGVLQYKKTYLPIEIVVVVVVDVVVEVDVVVAYVDVMLVELVELEATIVLFLMSSLGVGVVASVEIELKVVEMLVKVECIVGFTAVVRL